MARAEIKITGVDVVSRALSKTLEMTIVEVATLTKDTAVKKTPIKTGFTRKQWTQTYSKRDFEVANRVPWIGKLEAGASRQAPKGIIGPTLTTVKGKLK
jgi:hypothetical protein